CRGSTSRVVAGVNGATNRVGAGVHARPVEPGSTSLELAHREGRGFSRAESGANVIAASAAGVSRAKAPNFYEYDNGATKVAPLPSEPDPRSPYDEPSESDRYEMIRTYFQMLIAEELPDATGKMKQFASWFTHGVPGGAGLRKAIYDSKAPPEILTRVEAFFEARLANGSAGVESAAQLVP